MRRLAPVLAALWLAAASGCGPADENHAGMTPLKIAAQPFVSNAPIFIAQDEGFFAAEHITIDTVQINRSGDALPSLLQNALDLVGGTLSSSVVNAIARKGAIRAVSEKGHVAAAGECMNQALLVRPALMANGLFRRPGRRLVLAGNPTTYSRMYTERALATANPPLTINDVEMVDIPDALVNEALRAGRLDAAPAAEPWITAAIESHAAVVWKSATDFIPGFQHSFIFFGARLLAPDSDIGVRFLRAYFRGVDRLAQGVTPRVVQIVAAHTHLDPALLSRSCWPGFTRDGKIDPRTLDDYQEWALSHKLIDRRVSLEEFWTSRFVDAARAGSPTPR